MTSFALATLWGALLLPAQREAAAESMDAWPQLERLELELDLSQPPACSGVAAVTLAAVRGARVPLLLNERLAITAVTDERGQPLAWADGGQLRSGYFEEARVRYVELAAAPAGGRVQLRIAYSGRGMDGSEGQDWRGILLLAPDELRMSEQTVFYPQWPLAEDGPQPQAARGRLRVRLPERFEVYAPGKAESRRALGDGLAEWSFTQVHPGTLALLAGDYQRRETERDGARIVTLLRAEHADLAGEFATQAAAVLAYFTARYGAAGDASLGIVEIRGRGDSYNWAQQGVITFDGLALRGGVPLQKLAHEIAHLWWGQRVPGRGPGERFLTESLAEYSAWRYLEHAEGAAAARRAAAEARGWWSETVHQTGADPALAEVTFATPGYNALAYAKGPLLLRHAENLLGAAAMDRALADYAQRGAAAGGTLALLRACLERAGGRPLPLPWLDAPGHAHLALAGAAADGVPQRLRLQFAPLPCPAELPFLAPSRLDLDLRAPGRRELVAVTLDGELRESPVVEFPEVPEWIGLDPQGCALLAEGRAWRTGGARLLQATPAPGAEAVELGPLEVRLSFDRPLLPLDPDAAAAVEAASLAVARTEDLYFASVMRARLEAEDRVLVLDLDGTIPGEEHVLVIPDSLTDALGIPLDVRLQFRLRGIEGLERPRVLRCEPAHEAAGVPLTLPAIRVTFSGPMRGGVGFPASEVEKNAQRGLAFPAIRNVHWENPSTLVFDLQGPLRPETRYALPFRWHYRDLRGVPCEDWDYQFTTGR